MTGQQLAVGDVFKFVLAGNATFTVVRPERTRKVTREVAGAQVEVEVDEPAARFTFAVRRAKGGDPARPWFVKLLTGPDNNASYTFIGSLFPIPGGAEYRHSYTKSPIKAEAPSVRCIRWLSENITRLGSLEIANKSADMFQKSEIAGEVAAVLDRLGKVEVWHEGRCGRCNRKLTVPTSIASGIGPECANKVGGGM